MNETRGGTSPSEMIAAAARVQNFLKDEAIAAALGRLERKYYEEFKTASDDAARVVAQAKARVRDDFLNELQIILAAGEREVFIVADQAKRADRAPSVGSDSHHY